jgi:DNA-binding HxlR family transcriptional regulator
MRHSTSSFALYSCCQGRAYGGPPPEGDLLASLQRIGAGYQVQKVHLILRGASGRLPRMRGYSQYCPIAQAAEVLTERWTLLVLRELVFRGHRFNDIRRGVPLMSQSLLAKRLRDLEAARLIERRAQPRGGTEYHLTEAGLALKPLISQIGEWGKQWLRRTLTQDQLDAGVLMWDIRGCVDSRSLPPGRTVVQVEFTDLPEPKKYWWLVNENDEVDLCLKDPGFEVALYLVTDLRTLTDVWMGEVSLTRAMEEGTLEVYGRAEIRRCLRSWLQLSPFAGIRRRDTR